MKKYITSVNCLRVGDHFEISWDNADREELSIFYNSLPEADGREVKLCSSNSGDVRVEDRRKGCRSYFILQQSGAEFEITAERLLPLKGACNFRDLGGYVSADGRRVKWNRFYRSGTLANLTAGDLVYLSSLGLKKILDYRSVREVQEDPDVRLEGAEYINTSAMPLADRQSGDFSLRSLFERSGDFMAQGKPAELMKEGYREMMFDNRAFRQMVAVMQEADDRPFLQHCQSGKDRTGLGSALLLLILGVPMETVKEDYLASNLYVSECNRRQAEKYQAWLNTPARIQLFELLAGVRAEFFDSAFDCVFEKYTTLEKYLDQEYGLNTSDIKILRDRYLY